MNLKLKENNKLIFLLLVLVSVFLSISHSLNQVAVDGGLALAEIIKYPEPVSPMKYHYFNSWTLLHQFSQFFLNIGFSVENVSRIILFFSTFFFASSAFIITQRFTSNRYLALLVSILMLVLEKNFGDTDYPSLIFSNHSFGMFSLALSSFVFALILNENYKSSGFFSALLFSIHPVVGLWILSILILSGVLLKNKKINLNLFKGAILGSIITIFSFVIFLNNTVGKLEFDPQIFKFYMEYWDAHRNLSGYLHYEYLVKTLALFFLVNSYYLLLSKKRKSFFLIAFNLTIILSLISYLLYKFFPQIFPDLLVMAMPSRFLILHSFIGWPLIIATLYSIFSQFNLTKKFIKIFIFSVLILHSIQHYKNFVKIKNGFVLNDLEKSKLNHINIFRDISHLDLKGYFITTSSTTNYTIRLALKPVLLDVQSFDIIPIHPHLAKTTFEILENVYDVNIKNPPVKHNPYLPNKFVKKVFENKTERDWKLVKEKYNAKYVVVPSEWKIKLNLFKNNESFSIYKIE